MSTTTIYMTPETKERLTRLSTDLGMSQSEVMRRALEQLDPKKVKVARQLEREKKKAEREAAILLERQRKQRLREIFEEILSL